jgi:tetratricopeptide (TPR) repeat protein
MRKISMINQFLLNHIKEELASGKSVEKVKKWLISAGLKPSDFEDEFEFLANSGKANAIVTLKGVDGQQAPKDFSDPDWYKTKSMAFFPEEKSRWQRISSVFFSVFIILAIIATVIFGFQFLSKHSVALVNKAFSFASQTFTKIFHSKSISSTSTVSIIINPTSTIEATSGTTTTNATTANGASAGSTAIDVTAIVATQSATSTSGSTTFTSAISKARIFWQSGKYDDSLVSAKLALQSARNDKERARAQYWIGLSYYSQGNKTDSENAELSAVSFDSGYEPPYTTLAAIKLDQNNCNQALSYSQNAAQLIPNDPWALNNLGLAYLCLGDYQNAVIWLQNAAYFAPTSVIIQNNLYLALQQNQ